MKTQLSTDDSNQFSVESHLQFHHSLLKTTFIGEDFITSLLLSMYWFLLRRDHGNRFSCNGSTYARLYVQFVVLAPFIARFEDLRAAFLSSIQALLCVIFDHG